LTDHGGDADPEAQDVYKGIELGFAEVTEKDPAIIGEHGMRFPGGCGTDQFP
jgi:hypothetical protein